MNHALTGLAVLVALAMPLLAMQPAREGDDVAAVFPPWWDPARVTLAAMQGGDVAGYGGAGFVVLVPRGVPDRLRAAGAWFVLPAALLGGCAANGGTTERST
jgi:hypothetical protein